MINRLLLLTLLTLFHCVSFAGETYYKVSHQVGTFYRNTALAACVDAAPSAKRFKPKLGTEGPTSVPCLTTGSATDTYFVSIYTVYILVCPDTSPVFDYGTNKCVYVAPPKCPVQDAGTLRLTMYWATGPDLKSGIARVVNPPSSVTPSSTYCSPANCLVSPKGPALSCGQNQSPTAGYYEVWCNYPMQQTGGECPGTTPPTTPPPPTETPPPLNKCPTGSVPTGTDSSGLTICTGNAPPTTPPTKTTTSTPTTTTNNPDGSKTETKSTTSTNSDGSTTTTTTTTTIGADGQTTVTANTTTSPAPSGNPGDEDMPEEKSDLCKLHPNLNVCKNSMVNGACEAISCDGDAIQCETLRTAAKLECSIRKDREDAAASSLTSLGTAIGNGADPSASTLPSKATAVQVAMPSTLDSSGWLGGGAKFADKSFTLMGKTIVIPFSAPLEYLIILRYALMIASLLVSFRILSGAIIRE